MFVHSNFEEPKPEPVQENRRVGLLVLLVCMVLCLLFSLGFDATVLIPSNATKAVTQTWQAQHPPTATLSVTSTPRRFRPTATMIPNNPVEQARNSAGG